MRRTNFQIPGLLLLVGLSLINAKAQQPKFVSLSLTDADFNASARRETPPLLRPSPALIVKSFIAAETKFRETLTHFSFKRDVVLQTIGPRGEVTGEYLRNSVFVLDDRGQRIERVIDHPKPTMKEMIITKEDIQDLAGSQLFGLELAELNAYNLSYLGQEKLNGRSTYVIGISPKIEPDPNHMSARFFVGRIWIDGGSFQPIKFAGVTEPHGKQRFPTFETERDITIENLLFPSSTSADEVLRFQHRNVHYRVKVRYYDFKRFAGRLTIVELE